MEIIILAALIGFAVIFIILIRDGRKTDYYGKPRIRTPYRAGNVSQGCLVQTYRVSHSMSEARAMSKSAPVVREAIEKVADSEVPQESLHPGTVSPAEPSPKRKKSKAAKKAAAQSAMTRQDASTAEKGASEEEEFTLDRFWKLKKERAEQEKTYGVLSIFTGAVGFLISLVGALVFFMVGIYSGSTSAQASLIPIVIALAFAWNAKKQFRNLFNKEI